MDQHATLRACAAPEQAYTDYHGMMDLTEDLIRAAAREVTGGLQVGMPPHAALVALEA